MSGLNRYAGGGCLTWQPTPPLTAECSDQTQTRTPPHAVAAAAPPRGHTKGAKGRWVGENFSDHYSNMSLHHHRDVET